MGWEKLWSRVEQEWDELMKAKVAFFAACVLVFAGGCFASYVAVDKLYDSRISGLNERVDGLNEYIQTHEFPKPPPPVVRIKQVPVPDPAQAAE